MEPPQIFVLSPDLTRNEEGKLPHVYSTEFQKLCLHYPPERCWHSKMLIAPLIIPWASEWLYFYEIWVATGKWMGGGTHKEDNEYRDMHFVDR